MCILGGCFNTLNTPNTPNTPQHTQIDKEGANAERAKQMLSEAGLLPEEWGGDTPMVPVR